MSKAKEKFLDTLENKTFVRKTLVREDLKLAIKMSGLTRVEVARRLGVKYSLLSSWLCGFNTMPPGMEQKIKHITKIPDTKLRKLKEVFFK